MHQNGLGTLQTFYIMGKLAYHLEQAHHITIQLWRFYSITTVE